MSSSELIESVRDCLRRNLLEQHSPEKCMYTGCDSPPTHEVIWADGRGRAWHCSKHHASWASKSKDIVKHRKVITGRVGKKYGVEEHISGGEPQPKPPALKQRFAEVGLAKDNKGYFVYTHRARSDSYPSPEKIPLDKVKFIASTG